MNKIGDCFMISLASEIRINVSERLSRNVHDKLLELFVDRTSIDTSFRRFMNKDKLPYYNCKSLNDEKTIEFHQKTRQMHDVFDDERQIWISSDINPSEHDYFIPRR